eukprot:224477_1
MSSAGVDRDRPFCKRFEQFTAGLKANAYPPEIVGEMFGVRKNKGPKIEIHTHSADKVIPLGEIVFAAWRTLLINDLLDIKEILSAFFKCKIPQWFEIKIRSNGKILRTCLCCTTLINQDLFGMIDWYYMMLFCCSKSNKVRKRHAISNQRYIIQGDERFKQNEFCKVSNYGQTVKNRSRSLAFKNTLSHVIGLRKLNFINNAEDKIHYFEVTVDKLSSSSCAFIGVSASDRKIPMCITGGSFLRLNPQVGDTIGIMVDFKTSKWNGCMRIFRNKTEWFMKNGSPWNHNILSERYISLGIRSPISFCIGNLEYRSKFCFTFNQFPFIPLHYKSLFPMFHTEKQRIKNATKLMKENHPKQTDIGYILNIFVDLLDDFVKDKWLFGTKLGSRLKQKMCTLSQQLNAVIGSNVFEYDLSKKEQHGIIEVWNDAAYDDRMWEHQICSILCLWLGKMVVRSRRDVEVMFMIMSLYINPFENELKKLIESFANVCYLHREWSMVIRILNRPFMKAGNEYKKLEKLQNNMLCANCNKRWKLKGCKGCMKVSYCSRNCQKYHWRKAHRYKCDKSWYNTALYTIFCKTLHSL